MLFILFASALRCPQVIDAAMAIVNLQREQLVQAISRNHVLTTIIRTAPAIVYFPPGYACSLLARNYKYVAV